MRGPGPFRQFANRAAKGLGSPWAFVGACAIVLIWILSGPLFSFSDTWQLVINTGTTIITFLMVFLIQNTQNRDARAIQLKLDELVRALDTANDELIDIEDSDDAESEMLLKTYEGMREARAN